MPVGQRSLFLSMSLCVFGTRVFIRLRLQDEKIRVEASVGHAKPELPLVNPHKPLREESPICGRDETLTLPTVLMNSSLRSLRNKTERSLFGLLLV